MMKTLFVLIQIAFHYLLIFFFFLLFFQIDIDKTELEDAKWVTRGELKKMLKDESSSGMPGLIGGPDIYIPPPQAIANRLITSWTFEE